MGFWDRLINGLIKLFGGKKTAATQKQITENVEFEDAYEKQTGYNITAIFANTVAVLVAMESTVGVYEQNGDKRTQTKRTALLDKTVKKLWFDIKRIVARVCGTGGAAIVPYVEANGIYCDIVAQGCIAINRMRGDEILAATVLADEAVIGDNKYYRWVDYSVDTDGEQNVLTITNKAVRGDAQIPVPLSDIEQWAGIAEEIRIKNVDRVPFAYIKSPVDNRRVNNAYGVPLTYGHEDIIADIVKTLKQIDAEYNLKKVKVGADERLFDKKGNVSELYFKLSPPGSKETAPMWEIFDPAIRDGSFYNKLQNQFALLEKAVGTSRGILTDRTTTAATATEIKASNMETFALVEDVRNAIEKGVSDFLYACNVLAEYANLTPPSGYAFSIEWDYSLIENSSETFQQLAQAYSFGAVGAVDIRQQLYGSESREDAQKAVDEIAKTEPPLRNMLPGAGGGAGYAEQ
jgi:A118 family predicted phage portal protein